MSNMWLDLINTNLNSSSSLVNLPDVNHNLTTRSSCSNVTTTVMPDDNEAETLITFRIIVDVFIVGILCLVGFAGNAMSIAVLYRDHDKKNTTNWLLQTLAVVDTLYLTTCFFFQTLNTVYKQTDWIPGLKDTFPYMMKYVWAFASITQTITVWTVTLVTLDRYIAICMPLRTHLRSLTRAKVAVTVVVVLAIVYNIPRFFERKIIVTEWGSCVKMRRVDTLKTEFRKDRVYFLVYKTVMYFIFRTIGPLLVLIVLNVKLIRALQEVRRRHNDMTRGRKHSENITLMLVVVVSVFIICEIPDLILRITITMYEFGIKTLDFESLKYANVITNMLLTVNSSINFLIYCLVGKKFRKLLLDMYGCGRPRNSVPELSETEPLTTRTNVTKNGTPSIAKDGDVCL